MIKSKEYWIRRSEWIFKNGMKDTDKINKTIQEGYKEVLEDIERDISVFLGRYQTMKDINKPLTIKEYSKSMDSLWKEYRTLKHNNKLSENARKRVMSRINEMNARYRRTRLEVLKEHVNAKLDLQGIKTHEKMMEGLAEIYGASFDRKTYTLARGLGYGWQYTSPPCKEIENAIL
ncbi:MAG: hypothetical protein N4A50_14350 [Vallitalea sp.]|jgi:hypothetical protein|nr:hypothetical protein [Vallitalea sp.]